MKIQYEVQTRMFNRWESCWMDHDDQPVVFDSMLEAQFEIDETVKETEYAVMAGDMENAMTQEDFRIITVVQRHELTEQFA